MEVSYQALIDNLEELNTMQGEYMYTLGIRDTNWISPGNGETPFYKCQIIINKQDKDNNFSTVITDEYISQDMADVDTSLTIMLDDANMAIRDIINEFDS
jgi:hypothetical protein